MEVVALIELLFSNLKKLDSDHVILVAIGCSGYYFFKHRMQIANIIQFQNLPLHWASQMVSKSKANALLLTLAEELYELFIAKMFGSSAYIVQLGK